jgi:hypothetical protein
VPELPARIIASINAEIEVSLFSNPNGSRYDIIVMKLVIDDGWMSFMDRWMMYDGWLLRNSIHFFQA